MADDIEPTSRTYVSQGLKLHYLDWGNEGAPALILIHGTRDHARAWDWVAQTFRDRFHVIVPDLRGHGDSAWSPDGAYLLGYFVLDLIEFGTQTVELTASLRHLVRRRSGGAGRLGRRRARWRLLLRTIWLRAVLWRPSRLRLRRRRRSGLGRAAANAGCRQEAGEERTQKQADRRKRGSVHGPSARNGARRSGNGSWRRRE